MSAIVGALACQRNSFLKTFNTKVISSFEFVPPPTSKEKQSKSKSKTKEFGVELEDTILFPEGGGQPFDKGTITILSNNKVIEVKSVLRENLKAIHIVNELIDPGVEVTVNLDWKRRIDHMQQHTGQHLLSAVFDTYGLETLSWNMGEDINYIELPKKIEDELVKDVQDKVNSLILEGVPISVVTPDQHGHEVDISHLPDDYDASQGIIRIVKIGELDANPCCGTHLTSTAQIQAISLLHQSPIRSGNSRLFFICGLRVANCLSNEHKILKNVSTNQLSCSIEDVEEKVESLKGNFRKANSTVSKLAVLEAKKILTNFEKGGSVAYVYHPDLPDYLTAVNKELLNLTKGNDEIDLSKKTLVLLSGAAPNGGMVKISGPQAESLQGELKTKLSNLKGGGKGANFQGKITKFEKGELDSVIKYLESVSI
ncbi:hypothetical protein SBY92_001285 [Candida maltosa Xu316]